MAAPAVRDSDRLRLPPTGGEHISASLDLLCSDEAPAHPIERVRPWRSSALDRFVRPVLPNLLCIRILEPRCDQQAQPAAAHWRRGVHSYRSDPTTTARVNIGGIRSRTTKPALFATVDALVATGHDLRSAIASANLRQHNRHTAAARRHFHRGQSRWAVLPSVSFHSAGISTLSPVEVYS